ncbi:MerR family transcriptional regulator [Leptothrix discophora]|uniref:MerR family transcriptional regulator n=1 Tax=Leptothrix discophora TaxID=89 RepID=A0ABT9G2K1_LEPDI|nr:MerR family transcriptional regulator [Leptothrix discophora]MDP4300687.1 MerR family transcriptional regulator [Leptothrix discophora]
MENSLPDIPPKRYFTIGEVSELCGVKPYVLRYWEQEFTQLRPMKRRGNRRYYQHHEVLLIRRIRDLLYEQGFTISGARNRLIELGAVAAPGASLPMGASGPADDPSHDDLDLHASVSGMPIPLSTLPRAPQYASAALAMPPAEAATTVVLPDAPRLSLRDELLSIRSLLDLDD